MRIKLVVSLFVLLWPAAPLVSVAQSRPSERAIDAARVLDQYKAIWVDGKQELIDTLFAPNVVRHQPSSVRPPEVTGREAYRAYIKEFRSLHPDLSVEVRDVMADGRSIAYRYTATAFVDPSRSKKFTFTGITIARLDADGKIAEEWLTWDTYDLMAQVGLVPQRQP